MRAVILLALASCTCSLEGSAISKTSAHLITASRMNPETIVENQANLIDIANRKLEATGAIMLTESGRLMLSTLVACALPANAIVTSADGIDFFGEVGLSPQWRAHRLDLIGRRWVTACILARVSGLAVAKAISMRGPNPALQPDSAERSAFPIEEGAFWGNVFEKTQIEIACTGRQIVADRICANVDPGRAGFTLCGFQLAGACKAVCKFEHGAYRDCKANQDALGSLAMSQAIGQATGHDFLPVAVLHSNDEVAREVITTFGLQ